MLKLFLIKWNNLKIAIRLFIVVLITLFLTLIVGLVGLTTIDYQIHSQKLANESIYLVSILNQARKNEKNFILTSIDKYEQKTMEDIYKIKEKSDFLQQSFIGENKNIIQKLSIEVEKYKNNFKAFVRLNKTKDKALSIMLKQARSLEDTAVVLRDDQKKELQVLENSSIDFSNNRQEKSEKADDANRIIKLMGEARQQEKNFLLRNHKRYSDKARNFVNKLILQAKSTKQRFEDTQNKELAQDIIKIAQEYLRELDIVVDGKQKSILVHTGMIQLGRDVEEKLIELRKDQKNELVELEKLRETKLTTIQNVVLVDKRKKVDTTNQIIKLMAEARQQEKNFLLRKEESYAEVTISIVNQMQKELIILKKIFKNKENQVLASSIIKIGKKYLIEFEKLVKITNENIESQDVMASLGREVEDRAAQLRSDQKQELKRLEKLSKSYSLKRFDKRIKADAANSIIKIMSEARQQEKNFLLRHEKAYVDITINLVKEAVREAHILKSTFNDVQNRTLIDKVSDAAQIYLKEFENIVIINQKQVMQQKRMIIAANAIEKKAKLIEKNTRLKARQVQDSAIFTIITALILTLTIGILATFFLSISIAKPISKLVNVINMLAKEDDTDVPLVNQKDEIGDIARAISSFKRILLQRREKTEAQLIQSEKMAALGDLVAGIAHEINTPIGIAMTGSTHLQDQIKNMDEIFESGALKKAEFRAFISNALPTASTIEINLARASSLIKSFKQIAVDQSSQDIRFISIYKYIEDIVRSLHPKLKSVNQKVTINGDKKLHAEIVPGALSQIITNLIMNSLIHAYPDKITEGNISINIDMRDDMVHILYKDDGIGIDKKIIKRIFEPFYTTKRSTGGSGLGLSIVYNLLTQTLGGSIHCYSELKNGTVFDILFPQTYIKQESSTNE